MPTIKLTEKTVEKLRAPDPSGRQVLHWDADLKGFGVLCSGTSNTRSYVVQAAIAGNTRRITVGRVNVLKLATARQKAAEVLAGLVLGHDPKAAAGSAPTLAAVLKDYLAARGSNLSPRTTQTYSDLVKLHLDAWLAKPINQITAEMVENRHRAIADAVAKAGRSSGKATANSVMRVLRLLWNHALLKNLSLGRNPVQLKGRWHKVTKRTRLVKGDQMAVFYRAVCELPNKVHADYLLTLLFTGMRRRECASLRWDHIDFKSKVMSIPEGNTKGDDKLDLPLSDFLLDLLVRRRALGDAGGWVFPSNSKSGYLEEPKFALGQVEKVTGIKVSVHDLRRTFVTTAERCPLSPMERMMLVNHSPGKSVHGDYIQLTIEDLREPAQTVANRLKELCEIEAVTADNVARLR